MDMPYDIRLRYKKIDFQLPGNLIVDSVILDTVQLPVKNHLFADVSSDELVVTENESMHPNIEFTHQIKVCFYLKANKADCIEP